MLRATNYAPELPIMLQSYQLCSRVTNYARNYASIIGKGLVMIVVDGVCVSMCDVIV